MTCDCKLYEVMTYTHDISTGHGFPTCDILSTHGWVLWDLILGLRGVIVSEDSGGWVAGVGGLQK